MNPVFQGKVEKGELILDNPERYKKYLQVNMEGKKVVLSLGPKLNHRSPSQHRFYWAYLGIIEAETGNTAFDMHEYFKRILLPPRFIKVMGKEIKIPASTKDLSKGTMIEYMMKISSLTEVPIPDPMEWGFAFK